MVLFSHVAHIEQLFVMLLQQQRLVVEVSQGTNNWKWPDHEFLKHEHSQTPSKVSGK